MSHRTERLKQNINTNQNYQALRNLSDLDFGDRFLDLKPEIQVMKGEKLNLIKSKHFCVSMDIIKQVNVNYGRGTYLQVIQ